MDMAALCGTLTRKGALDFLSFYMSLIADLKQLKVSTLVAPRHGHLPATRQAPSGARTDAGRRAPISMSSRLDVTAASADRLSGRWRVKIQSIVRAGRRGNTLR